MDLDRPSLPSPPPSIGRRSVKDDGGDDVLIGRGEAKAREVEVLSAGEKGAMADDRLVLVGAELGC